MILIPILCFTISPRVNHKHFVLAFGFPRVATKHTSCRIIIAATLKTEAGGFLKDTLTF